jgi:hypothetical protein
VDFVAVADQVIALLRQRGRVAYRTLYNCHKNERNGNAYQRNYKYWPSPRLCRL